DVPALGEVLAALATAARHVLPELFLAQGVLSRMPVEVKDRGEGAGPFRDEKVRGDLRARAVVDLELLEPVLALVLLFQDRDLGLRGPGREIAEQRAERLPRLLAPLLPFLVRRRPRILGRFAFGE